VFAIPGSRVVEITRYDEMGDVPRVDLSNAIGGPPAEIGPHTCAVVVQRRETHDRIGLVVDEATEVVVFRDEDIVDPPDFGPRIALPYLAGLARKGDGFTLVLDVDGLLAGMRGDS
jgi:purine-binding chemotaxis protein CheW